MALEGLPLHGFNPIYLIDIDVSINGENSNLMTITCEFPKDQYLDPYFFSSLLMIYQMFQKSLSFTYLLMILTFTESECPEKLAKKVNTELRYAKRWLDANKLSLNVDKTNYIIFHSPGNKVPPNYAIKIGNKHISKAKYVKFLGLLLDEHLTWSYHLCQLSKKLSRTCGILHKIRRYLTIDTMKCIYNSLFMSFMQYGITVWGQTYESYIEPIFKLQKKLLGSYQTRHPVPLPCLFSNSYTCLDYLTFLNLNP